MTFGEEMKEAASEIIDEFSRELGPISIVIVSNRDYDTSTGVTSETKTPEETLAVFTSISVKEVPDQSFRDKHMKVLIAGEDIASIPNVGDLILNQSGEYHRIADVYTDQYEALYTMYVENKVSEA